MDLFPDVFTADYTGKPGQRTFFIQARGESGTASYLVEKQQVAILAERLRELLLLLDEADTVRDTLAARDPALALEEPIEPEWRVGQIGISYDEEVDALAIAMGPVTEDEDDAVDPDMREFPVRYLLRRDQVRSFVLHALAAVEEGRPICQLCGLPMDPDGHKCPASNGHRLSE